eukprot:TRINITY_DN96673_c0_g1_i1.p1 TRINITY_DN96673_c0_g1~~TRINITY_DN96673_c0_g1_i1.p1  ORF type:complete len:117 (+),score=8.58 TRINITY_DN96673_c0_g1_i1:102-452(+)
MKWLNSAQSSLVFVYYQVEIKQCFSLLFFRTSQFSMPNVYFICWSSGELLNHLLLHCPFSNFSWIVFLNLISISWIVKESFGSLMQCWGLGPFKNRSKILWRMVPLAILGNLEGEE